MQRVRSKSGFTLIELMIVVAIVGILAVIAIPAYLDYTKKTRMTEVLTAMDAIAQGAAEYYSVLSYFPDDSYGSDNLARFSEEYATIDIVDGSNSNEIFIEAAFNANLDLTKIDTLSTYGELVMRVTYESATGYGKSWDLAQTTIDPIYMPR
jgi:type IV pilus assembly protein PilA